MFKHLFAAVLVVTGFTGLCFTQEKTFDSELSGMRKNIIAMCAQLQAGQPKESQEQLLKEIDGIIGGWEGITAVYKNTPPKEYAKDPSWKSYFDEALDNFQIMRQKADGKDYNRAMQFCGQNCGLFVKIHQVSGKVTLSDKLFVLRQNIKLAISMAKASNWNGSAKMLKHTSEIFTEINALPVPAGTDKASYTNDVKQIKASFDELPIIVNKKDIKETEAQFKIFLKDFGKIYLKYI